MYLGINIVQRLFFPFQGKDQVKFRNKIFSKGPLPTLPRSGGRQLVCLDSVDFVINSYTCNIPEGVRLVLGQLSYCSRLVVLRCLVSRYSVY